MTTPPFDPEQDPWLPERLRRGDHIEQAETRLFGAARAALRKLLAAIGRALTGSDMNTDVLDARMEEWRTAVDTDLIPAVEHEFREVYTDAVTSRAPDDATYDVNKAVGDYLDTVQNRLVDVADTVFDVIRGEIETGRNEGESVEELAARIDAVLDWNNVRNWDGRAMVIARTETISAYNMGQYRAAQDLAPILGFTFDQARKRWLATNDTRTRDTHAKADGQTVGAEEMFTVGGFHGLVPGDPRLPAQEVVQCRCTPLFLFPGDPGYDALTASVCEHNSPAIRFADGMGPVSDPDADVPTGNVIVALPSDDGPIHGLGEEQKHITLAWLGNGELHETHRQLIARITAKVVKGNKPFTVQVSGRAELGADKAKVLLVESQELADVRAGLLSEVASDSEASNGDLPGADEPTIGDIVEVESTYPTWIPHMTLTYGEMPEGADGITEIPIDRLALWFGPDQYEYNLGGDEVDEDTQATTIRSAGEFEAPSDALLGETPLVSEPMPETRRMWHGVIVPEGRMSGDRRKFAVGALRSRVLPLPLRWQERDEPGHGGSVVVGNIEGLRRAPDSKIRAWGYMHDGEHGWKVTDLIEQRMLRGVSVDADDLESSAVEFQHSDGTAFDFDNPQSDPVEVYTDARVASAAICSIPAFEEAYVALGAPPPEWYVEGEALLAAHSEDLAASGALVASAAPASAFSDPKLTGPTPLTITDDGRVFGHVATWGTCHIGYDGVCTTPPRSRSGYSYFTTGEVVADGQRIPVGQITFGTGHAKPGLRARPAAAHYDNTGHVGADVAIGEDAYGIWIAGAIRPTLTPDQIAELRASAISGDWRKVNGDWELVAALGVNVPGFPIPRTAAGMAAGQQVTLVAAGIVHQPEPRSLVNLVIDALDRRERFAAADMVLRGARVRAATRTLALEDTH